MPTLQSAVSLSLTDFHQAWEKACTPRIPYPKRSCPNVHICANREGLRVAVSCTAIGDEAANGEEGCLYLEKCSHRVGEYLCPKECSHHVGEYLCPEECSHRAGEYLCPEECLRRAGEYLCPEECLRRAGECLCLTLLQTSYCHCFSIMQLCTVTKQRPV